MKRSVNWLFIMTMLLLLFFSAAGVAEERKLVLPEDVLVIEEEAFYDSASIDRVQLPSGILRIEKRAFAKSSLKHINLPETLEYIAPDAFDECPYIIRYNGEAGSYAQEYCDSHGFIFIPYEVPVVSVEITDSVATSYLEMNVGETYQLHTRVLPENASWPKLAFSSQQNFVEVDNSGLVRAIAPGIDLIKVMSTDGSMQGMYLSVVVNDNSEVSATVSGSGNTRTISVTANNAWTAKSDVTWITLSKTSGTAGTVSITATLAENPSTTSSRTGTVTFTCGTKTASVTITQAASVAVTGVSLSTVSKELTVGGSFSLIVTVSPSNATNKTVTWKSGNTAVATVNSSGLVTAVGAGSATITVTTTDGSKTATCAVTVKIPVTGVTLSKTSATMNKGATLQLTATVAPSNATTKTVTWKSSNTAVATVNSSGLVTAVGAGSATITVTTTDGSKTATCAVTVKIPVTGVTLSKTSATMNKGATLQLTATVAPSDATTKTVTWKSSNTAVATVNSSGLVTAVGAGSATITVTTTDGSKTATCAVTVKIPVTGVTLSKTSAELKIGGTVTLTATVAPSNATNKSVTWSSSNTSVATVSSSGVVTGKTAGTATITVTTTDGAKTATCKVTVYNAPTATITTPKTSYTTQETVPYTINVSGGKGPYTVHVVEYLAGAKKWEVTFESSTATQYSYVADFKTGGTNYIVVTVTDSLGSKGTKQSGNVTIKQVNPVSTAPVISSITTSNDAVTLKWNAVTNAVSYTITAKSTASDWVGTYSTTSTNWTHDWFSDGTYSFTVTAVGDATVSNNSKTSAAKTITVKANKITAGPTPTITVSGTSAKITWPAVANATWYEIELYTSAGYANLLNKGSTQQWYYKKIGGSYGDNNLHNATSYTFTGLSSGVYMVKVSACNAGGHWAFGEVRDFVIGTATNYPVKAGPTVTLTVNGSSIHATWNAVENAAIYRACLYTASGYPNNVIYKDLYTRNNWADFSGLPDGTYYVAVAGEGTFSDPDGSKGGWKYGTPVQFVIGNHGGNSSLNRFMEVAEAQIGVYGDNNNNKFSQHTGTVGYAWCAPMVAWCANESKVSCISHTYTFANPWLLCTEGTVYVFKDVSHDSDYTEYYNGSRTNKSYLGKWSSFVPQRGDLIFIDNSGPYNIDHVMIVYSGDPMKFINPQGTPNGYVKWTPDVGGDVVAIARPNY